MFRGVVQLNLDGKNRLAVPTKYRDALASPGNGRLILTADPASPCLLLYAYPVWEAIEQKLLTLSAFDDGQRSIQRMLMGFAEDVEMDGAGRILISQSLRDHAQLNKRAVMVGLGNKFELWNDEKWEEQCKLARALRETGVSAELRGFTL